MKLDCVAVGQIIREERKAQGLRQVELAAASGVQAPQRGGQLALGGGRLL